MERIKVAFSGLKNKEYDFSFNIGDKFFEHYPALAIQKGDLTLNAHLDKRENALYFTLIINGNVYLQCDRCLDFFKYQLDFDKLLYIKRSESVQEIVEESDDVLLLPSDWHEIDLTQYVYEFIMLELPIKRVHEMGVGEDIACNNNIMEILKNQNQSVENGKEEIDPRWEALKKLKDKI